MAVSAADVKKLRDMTGAGMMDCKKALEEADGDFDKAVEILRIGGLAKAAKLGSERTATNGLVAAAEGAMIELNSETDFVAKNEEFMSLASDIVAHAARTRPADAAELAAQTLADGRTVAAGHRGDLGGPAREARAGSGRVVRRQDHDLPAPARDRPAPADRRAGGVRG